MLITYRLLCLVEHVACLWKSKLTLFFSVWIAWELGYRPGGWVGRGPALIEGVDRCNGFIHAERCTS